MHDSTPAPLAARTRKSLVSQRVRRPESPKQESRPVQMKIRVPDGRSVPFLNAFGPCWITYDSSRPPGMKWVTHYGSDENLAPVILDALASGDAVLEYLTPGLGDPVERVARAAGCEHPPHPGRAASVWPAD